ncbi:hypothetical protein T10_6237 [Trichinella papuae]|uniref:Uncharacterized protein n=1 Tax=Trichinella papuae TaxID=268474 RepID=A0A0V1M692_9BILA|nr:hypothetical protein T10_6237 [Trichinella papuae]
MVGEYEYEIRLDNGGIKHIIRQSVISGSCSSSMCYELRVGTELSENSDYLEESDCSYSTVIIKKLMIDQLASFGSRRALGKILLIQKDEYGSKHCNRQMRQSVVVLNEASIKNQFLKNRSDRGELFEQCNLSQCFVRFDRLERTVFSSSSSSPSSSTSYFTTPAKHIPPSLLPSPSPEETSLPLSPN